MTSARIINQLRPWMLPIAMVVGLAFHNVMEQLAFLSPWLIFSMLLITYLRIDFTKIRPDRMTWLLLAAQLLVSLVLWFIVRQFDPVIAAGVFICVFCPTATAAPVITAMLGGSLPRLVSFSLISNIAVSLLTPVLLPMMAQEGITQAVGFLPSMALIATRLAPLLLLPMLAAYLIRKFMPGVTSGLSSRKNLAFYIWAVSLVIIVGQSVGFVMHEPSAMVGTMLLLAGGAVLTCILQFWLGRRIGRRFGDAVSGAQGLGQKNTVLAVWMCLTWLDPVTSVAPAAYIPMQNLMNAWHLYRAQKPSKNHR